MTMSAMTANDLLYPDSDGKPMAEDQKQGRVIRTLVAGFERLYHDRDDVNVGGDFFWYPVEGEVQTVVAPDVTVIFGTPNVLLRSYRQWEHGGQPVLVVEVLSFSNTRREMERKRRFYERYGVLEYWVVDPHKATFEVWLRDGDRLVAVPDPAQGFVSPTSQVVARLDDGHLVTFDPGGTRRWLEPAEEGIAADEAQRVAHQAQRLAHQAEARADRAERELAELRRQIAEQSQQQ